MWLDVLECDNTIWFFLTFVSARKAPDKSLDLLRITGNAKTGIRFQNNKRINNNNWRLIMMGNQIAASVLSLNWVQAGVCSELVSEHKPSLSNIIRHIYSEVQHKSKQSTCR